MVDIDIKMIQLKEDNFKMEIVAIGKMDDIHAALLKILKVDKT